MGMEILPGFNADLRNMVQTPGLLSEVTTPAFWDDMTREMPPDTAADVLRFATGGHGEGWGTGAQVFIF